MWSYDRSLLPGRNIEHARAMAMVVLTFASAAITAVLSRLRTTSAWFMTLATLGLAWLLVQTPVLASYLHLKPLHRDDWLIASVGGLLSVGVPILVFSWRRRPTTQRQSGCGTRPATGPLPRTGPSPRHPRRDHNP